MKVLAISISMICLMSCQAQGQVTAPSNGNGDKTKAFFQSWVEKKSGRKRYREKIARIKVASEQIDNLPLEKYSFSRFHDDFDFNKDGKEDYVVLITRDEEAFDPNSVSSYNYYALLYFEASEDSSYFFKANFMNLMNQGTEGLMDVSGFINNGEKLIHRQFGIQIDTEWCTEFIFEMDNGVWYLKEANMYKAYDNVGTFELRELVKSEKITERIPIDSVNYYDYFPLGFSDGIY